MTYYVVKPTVWKRTTNPGTYSSLSSVCCLIVVLGALLVPSIGTADPCKEDGLDDCKHEIMEVLFGLEVGTANRKTNHDYNDYGVDGHAGWDVQTTAVFDPERNAHFYSLTAGEVIAIVTPDEAKKKLEEAEEKMAEAKKEGKTIKKEFIYSMIAVYDGEKTTLYLHPQEVFVSKGQYVNVGTCLGRQGDIGTDVTGPHVHLEVRRDRAEKAGGIAGSENPIPYLYRSVTSVVPKWDVNQNGLVNFWDLILVMSKIGETDPRFDVNCDRVVNWSDVWAVWDHLGESADFAAPTFSAYNQIEGFTVREGQFYIDGVEVSREMVQQWLNIIREADDGSLTFKHHIAMLERLLAAMAPEKDALLANYPNPFNPETWMPYQLANDSDVQITIYDTRGTVVRRLKLGHQRAGYYISRSRAAHWDGRNRFGEQLASGIYFYQLQTANFSPLRKMVILK